MFTYEMLLQNIRDVIQEKGLKQKAVAQRLGCSEQEFSNMLNNRKAIKPEYIPVIALALGVDFNKLYRVRS